MAAVSSIARVIPGRRWLLAIAGAAAALYAGCSDGPTDPSTTSVPSSMTAASATMLAGEAGAPVSERPTVTVLDQHGNPMFGIQVTFAVASGGGLVSGATVATDAQGMATVGAWTLGTAVGSNTLTATSGSLTPITFTAMAAPGAVANLEKSAGDNQAATVGTAVPVAPSVTVRDQHNNVVAGVTVTFAVASGDGSVTGAEAVSNASGIATVGSWTLGITPGVNTLTATLNALEVTFTATGEVGTPSTITKQAGDTQTAVAGTAVAVNPSVRITDQHGNPVAGAVVTFAILSGGGSLTGASPTTDASGVATVGSWTLGSTAGANSVTATIGALSATFTATGTAGAAANIAKHAGDAQDAIAGSAVAVAPAVRITDANGNPVAGVSVNFTVASGGGSVTGDSPSTDADGVATVGSWTLGTTAGPNTLTAAAGSLSTTFTATGVAGAPVTMVAHDGDAQTATVGAAVAESPAARITDGNGNPVSGVTVTFMVTSGGGSVTGETADTDANGVATVGSWTLGTTAGANTLTATAGALQVTFSATGTPGAPAQMTKVAGDGQSAQVGTAVSTNPSVRVTDVFGNDVPNVMVTFAVVTGGGSATGTTPTTSGSGVATVGSWTLGEIVGENTLTASAVGTPGVTFTANGTPGPAANITKLAGDEQNATVNTAVAVAPSVRITDEFGNAVPNVVVTFAVANGGGSVTDGVQTTDGDGTATLGGEWTLDTLAGPNTLTATAGALVATFTATGTAGPPAIMSKQAGDNQSATVSTPVAVDPAVLVTDEFGNPVANVSVTFAIASGGGSIAGAANQVQQTNGSGIATVSDWNLGTIAGNNTMTATAGALSVTFSATGTADEPDMVARLPNTNNQSATVGTNVPIPPGVRITDQYGNPVPDVEVTFTIGLGDGQVDGGSVAVHTTNANGEASVVSWMMGPVAGTNTLNATGGGLGAVFTATGTSP